MSRCSFKSDFQGVRHLNTPRYIKLHLVSTETHEEEQNYITGNVEMTLLNPTLY